MKPAQTPENVGATKEELEVNPAKETKTDTAMQEAPPVPQSALQSQPVILWRSPWTPTTSKVASVDISSEDMQGIETNPTISSIKEKLPQQHTSQLEQFPNSKAPQPADTDIHDAQNLHSNGVDHSPTGASNILASMTAAGAPDSVPNPFQSMDIDEKGLGPSPDVYDPSDASPPANWQPSSSALGASSFKPNSQLRGLDSDNPLPSPSICNPQNAAPELTQNIFSQANQTSTNQRAASTALPFSTVRLDEIIKELKAAAQSSGSQLAPPEANHVTAPDSNTITWVKPTPTADATSQPAAKVRDAGADFDEEDWFQDLYKEEEPFPHRRKAKMRKRRV